MGVAARYLIQKGEAKDELDWTLLSIVNSPLEQNKLKNILKKHFDREKPEIDVMDRSLRKTKLRRISAGRYPKYEVLGKDNNWYRLNDNLWAMAMLKLKLDKS